LNYLVDETRGEKRKVEELFRQAGRECL